MNANIVPGDDFMKETHDVDDELTIRSNAPQFPSTVLEEEITAAILRQAKERFHRRQDKYRQREAAAHETTAVTSQSAHSQSKIASEEGDRSSAEEGPTTDDAATAAADDDEAPKLKTKTYEAVVSADDDLSANLLRPSVRHILSMMDNTLTTLHNARLAGLSYMTDSSASATDVSDASEGSDAGSTTSRASRTSRSSRSSPRKRSRMGRPRSKTPRTPEPEQSGQKKRGRPRKVQVPLPGETEKEMMIRIARAQHKRIPFSSEEDNAGENGDAGRAIGSGDNDRDTAEDTVAEKPPSKLGSPRKKRDMPPEARMEAKIKHREYMLRDWGLRDWSDVIGAASLSGFKPDVVARAAQRCANLFGQGMDMQTLLEGPASKGPKPRRKRYLPNARARTASFPSSDEEGGLESFRGVRRRQQSRGREGLPPAGPGAQGRSPRVSSGRRSMSRSSSVGLFFCPVAGCERAVEGFDRKANLERHVARVHPGQAVEIDYVESENEMHGAVHVDGFLKPIRARKGWRAEDTGYRKRKRYYRGRRLRNRDDEGSGVGEESVWDSSS